MKTTFTKALILLACLGTASLNAQSKLGGSVYTGLLLPFNDFTDATYDGYQPNLGVGAALSYEIMDGFKLRGDLMTGALNGNNVNSFYRTRIIESRLEARYNVLSLLNPDSKVKIEPSLGGGLLFYSAQRFDLTSRQLLTESPIPTEKALSPNGFVSGGLEVGLPVATNLDFNLGYTHHYVLENDWMDGFSSGDYTDHYGMVTAGLTFYLKSTRKPGTVEIDQKKYNKLNARLDSLERYEPEPQVDNSRIAQLEMTNKEQELKIDMLEAQLDSAVAAANTASYTTDGTRPVAYNPNAQKILGTASYRIVVASLPSQVQAQRWVNRSNLDKETMVIAFIEDLNTFRVVYRSYNTIEAARKDLPAVRTVVPDAWIVRF